MKRYRFSDIDRFAMNKQPKTLKQLTDQLLLDENHLRKGGVGSGEERQRRLGRLLVRERMALLLDSPTDFFELGLWAGYQLYPEWGELPAAGVITGIGTISNRSCMIIANDATVKAGAFFPQTVKKVLRAQEIAYSCRLPIIYLVDSSGVFLPLQDEVFPDENDFGRIFRNNAVLSADGIPQIAAIMGNCIAGGGYLPVLCDKILMTEGSGLYLAGPALVKAAIGQVTDSEELGGAKMHAEISGTVDFYEKDDQSCLKRLRSLIELLPSEYILKTDNDTKSELNPESLYDLVSADNSHSYDTRILIKAIADAGSIEEYKAHYGTSLITAYAKINGISVGIVASQRLNTETGSGETEMGGVIYKESADKAARFIMDCNQTHLPIVFLQDVMGFMVGKQAEQSGIIRAGAKLVNVISNSIVPKITLIIGNSFGAGHYALGGKAFDPDFICAWPNAKYAVMGADQAANTLFTVEEQAAKRAGKTLDPIEAEKRHAFLKAHYEKQTDIHYAAARGWVDAIISPTNTKRTISTLLRYVKRKPLTQPFKTGVIQV